MARTVESRRTVRTSRVEGADEIKSNLHNVANEIARVRDQAREEVNALEKIRGMLDTGYLNTLIQSIESLEQTRVARGREYFFGLYDRPTLSRLLDALPGVDAFRA